jgi:hypothetical protein
MMSREEGAEGKKEQRGKRAVAKTSAMNIAVAK